jgi:beta-mannosidase
MLACLPENQRKVHSFAWQVHDNSVATWTEPSAPDEMIRHWLGKEPREMSIEEFTYWAGLLQGEALREYCENFRRRMFDSGAAVYWMFNDCWPATRSWTTVDYYLRRTPSFHPVRRAMTPAHVVLAQDANQISIYGINDTVSPIEAELQFGIMHLEGRMEHLAELTVTLPPHASTVLGAFPLSRWTEPLQSAAYAMLTRDGSILSRNRLFLPRFHELQWSPADVQVTVRDGNAVFESDTFAWGVCLDLTGERALADNFFDLYPHIPHVIPWSDSQAPQVLRLGNLSGKSLR